jgi:hypothetical protein
MVAKATELGVTDLDAADSRPVPSAFVALTLKV